MAINRKKQYICSKPYDSPLSGISNYLNEIEVIEDDFFKERDICFLGMLNPFESYSNGEFPNDDIVGWQINKNNFLNLGVVAGSGVGKCILKDNFLRLEDGRYKTVKEYYYNKLKDKIATYNEKQNKIEFEKPIISRQEKIKRKGYRFFTDGGYEIEVTDNHRMLIMGEDGRLFEKISNNVSLNDYFCLYESNIKFDENLYHLNIKYKNCILKKRRNVLELINKGVSRINIIRQLNVNKSFVNNIYYNIDKYKNNSLDSDSYSLSHNSSCKKIKYVNDELIKVIAYLLAEGGLTHQKYEICFTNMHYKEDYMNCINKLFGNQNFRTLDDLTVSFSNKTICYILKEIGIDRKLSYYKSIPDFIFKLSNRQKGLFLNTFTSCDGHINKRGCIEITLANKKMISQLGQLFNDLSINCIYSNKKTKSTFGKAYTLNIGSIDSKRLFMNEIGMIDNKNIYRIKKSLKKNKGNSICSKTHYPKKLLNFNSLLIGFKVRKNIKNYIKNRKYITFDLLDKFEFLSKEKLKKYPFKILKVKKIEIFDINEYTYDLELPKNNNFFTGTKGLLLTHNTRTIKNIILSYYKANYNILVFSPKKDEWSSARQLGDAIRLHPNNENERIPIKSYAPIFVKPYLKNRQEVNLRNYTFYSHSMSSFTSIEMWESLGFSITASKYCAGLINSGIDAIDEIILKINNSNLMSQTKSSAINNLESLKSLEFINDKYVNLNLEEDFNNKKVVVINYFSKEGSLMSGDVSLIVEKIRELAQKLNKNSLNQPFLILFDDANYYASAQPHNKQSIIAITNCQINYRSYGMNLITSYQFPEVVVPSILKGSKTMLVSFLRSPESLKGSISEEALLKLKADEEDGGIVVDFENYNIQWIHQQEGRRWSAYYPEGCRLGHK